MARKVYRRSYGKDYYKLHKEEMNKRAKLKSETYTKINQEIARAIIGNECIVCGSDEFIHLHEIDGKKHSTGQYYYHLNHTSDFIPLCPSHHKLIPEAINIE